MELYLKIIEYFHDPIAIFENNNLFHSNKVFKEAFETNTITVINPELFDNGINKVYIDDKYYEIVISIIDNYKVVVFKDLTLYQDTIDNLLEYKDFFDESDIAFVRCNIKTGLIALGNLYFANLIGFTSVKELEGVSFFNYLIKEDKQKFLSSLKKKKKLDKYQFELITTGKKIWVEGDFHINCGVTCIEGYIHNITEMKKLEQELEQLQEINLKNMTTIQLKLDQLTSY